MKHLIILFLSLFVVNQSLAVSLPKDGDTDPRVKRFTYDVRDVFHVKAHYKFTSHIVLNDDEKIKHISVGDSLAWLIIPKGNHLFIKPIEDRAETNMTVLTTERIYNFTLEADKADDHNDKELAFSVSFYYPEDELAAALAKQQAMLMAEDRLKNSIQEEVVPNRAIDPDAWNFNYTRKGSDLYAPTRIFDDGEFTYFQFPKEIDTPAIFLVDSNKKESLINFHVKGKYVVVQRIAAQFILRHGDYAVCIFNEEFYGRKKPSEIPLAKTSRSSVASTYARSE